MRKAPKQKPRSPTPKTSDRRAKTSPRAKREGKPAASVAAPEIRIVEPTLKPIEAFINLANTDLSSESTPEIISCSRAVLEVIAKTGQPDHGSREWGYIRRTAKQRLKIENGPSDNPFGFDVVRDPQLSGSDLVYFYLYPFFVRRQATDSGSDKESGIKASQRARREILEVFEPRYESDISFLVLEALQKTDLRKIKRCTGCQRIYLSKNISRIQKYCSETCKRRSKWPPDRWANYISQLRKKKKQVAVEEANRNREEEIRRMMKSSGYTRGEILEMMEVDKKM